LNDPRNTPGFAGVLAPASPPAATAHITPAR
jgi:hypothetical protein